MRLDIEKVYKYIQKINTKRLFPPTPKEISDKFDLKGKSVYYHLNKLIKDGRLLETDPVSYRVKKVK